MSKKKTTKPKLSRGKKVVKKLTKKQIRKKRSKAAKLGWQTRRLKIAREQIFKELASKDPETRARLNKMLTDVKLSPDAKDFWKQTPQVVGDLLLDLRDFHLGPGMILNGWVPTDHIVLEGMINTRDERFTKYEADAILLGVTPRELRQAWFSPKPRARF